ncbi:hypothetical protein G9P44_000048 [Scheffersomyces stipitis]|nr:hypothetical protein G9P44_000048 [Scheffersomyces stipitis]
MSEATASNISTHYYKLGHLGTVSFYNYVSFTDNDQSLLELELSIRYAHPNILVTYYNKSLYYFTFGHNNVPLETVSRDIELPDLAKDINTDVDLSKDVTGPNPGANNSPSVQSMSQATAIPEKLDQPSTLISDLVDPLKSANSTDSSNVHIDLAKEFPTLQLKHSNTVNVELLANPPKSASSGSTLGAAVDEYLPFASLSLLKSIKKMILFNLSKNGAIKLFGNYCVVARDTINRSILYLDPILFPNGDLLLSMVVKERINLLDSSIIDLKYPSQDAPDINFVIYLIPSGIRCHLFDPTNLVRNFVRKKSAESENLIDLIKLSTGVEYSFNSEEENVWIKLIPNLKHLNNQTSNIAKFIHSVDNKKFILWPWKLCLLQFGKFEEVDEITSPDVTSSQVHPTSNPLDLIGDLIDFNISSNQHHNFAQPSQTLPFSISSVASTGGDAGIGSVDPHTTMEQQPHTLDLNDITTHMVPDLFDLQNPVPSEFFTKEVQDMPPVDGTEVKEDTNQDDVEMDDLFGGSDDEGDDSRNGQNSSKEDLFSDAIKEEPKDALAAGTPAELEKNQLNDLFDISDKEAAPDSGKYSTPGAPENENQDSKSPFEAATKSATRSIAKEPKFKYLDIPKDQMTIKKSSSPDYNDPGAPLPIMPTPIIPVANSVYSTNPPTAAAIGTEGVGLSDDQSSGPYNQPQPKQEIFNSGSSASQIQQKSIFSPILFNPIIKSNIDTKYGKGGKFYVDKEASIGPEEKKKKTFRETSVSGYELPLTKEEDKLPITAQAVGLRKMNNSSLSLAESSMSASSEESDEDEEMPDVISNSPPLRLNTFNDSFGGVPMGNSGGITLNNNVFGGSNNAIIGSNFLGDSAVMTGFNEKPINLSNYNTGGFGSPNSSVIGRFPNIKGESPFSTADLQQTVSPIDYEQSNNQHTPSFPTSQGLQITQSVNNGSGRTSSSDESPVKGISESSNYLPLILRSINVSTIPDIYLLNNLISDQLLPSFTINDDDNDNDLEVMRNNEMFIKAKHLDEFLELIGPNLVFDLGFNQGRSKLSYYMDELVKSKLEENKVKLEDSTVDFVTPDETFESEFSKVFPNSYKVNLIEFLNDQKDYESKDELEDQLDFLDDIANDDDNILNPKSQYKKLKSIEWDALTENTKNKENFEKYKLIVNKLNSSVSTKDEVYFKLPIIKARVLKHNNILNLNNLAINFWKYMNFSPIKSTKHFQVLLISENNGNGTSFLREFLDLLIYNYKECNLGHISKVNLSTVETRPDLENINDGILLVNKDNDQTYNDTYSQINKKLNSLVELIKLDLINKTNNFEFDRPLLLLFVNYNDNLNSTLQISKVFRNLKVSLTNHQLPLVSIFTKIIPGSLIVKQDPFQNWLKVLSNFKLSKLSMNLYNQCPNGSTNKDIVKNTFTQLVKEPPSRIQFKFMSNNFKHSNFNDDIFLHLAYERSIDRNWFSAAWSDPLGVVTFTKSWYCSNKATRNGSGGYGRDTHDVATVCEEIWNKSNELFKKLNDEMNNESSTMGGKKFLVLTRINSIIPDDELIHWKRLSVKHKDISLIVLSVSHSPKLIFQDNRPRFEDTENCGQSSTIPQSQQMSNQNSNTPSLDRDNFFKVFSGSNNSSPTTGGALVTSPNVLSFHSPQQFLNAPGNFLSPQDFVSTAGGAGAGATSAPHGGSNNPDLILHDFGTDVIGIIPKVPLPSFNSPTRLGMKIGYLLKEWMNGSRSTSRPRRSYLVYEVSLLSCSNYWDLDVLMKLILNHYKNLIVLNDILGLRKIDGNISKNESEDDFEQSLEFEASGIVPWHISAVGKSLVYLSHIYVDE